MLLGNGGSGERQPDDQLKEPKVDEIERGAKRALLVARFVTRGGRGA